MSSGRLGKDGDGFRCRRGGIKGSDKLRSISLSPVAKEHMRAAHGECGPHKARLERGLHRQAWVPSRKSFGGPSRPAPFTFPFSKMSGCCQKTYSFL